MIELRNIKKVFKGKKSDVIALEDFSLVYSKNNGMIFITGMSGSGKSSLLNILGGMDNSYEGEYIFDDIVINKLDSKSLNQFRKNNVSFVFQKFNLISELDNNTNVLINNQYASEQKLKYIEEYSKKLGVFHLLKKYPNQVSGGEAQRIAILRSLVASNKLLLADEPTGNLDYFNTRIIFEELKRISKENVVIVCSHDLESAKRYADIIIELENGKINKIRENKSTTVLSNDKYEIINNITGEKIIKDSVAFIDSLTEMISLENGKIDIIFNRLSTENTNVNELRVNKVDDYDRSLSMKLKLSISLRYIFNHKFKSSILLLIQTLSLVMLAIFSILTFHDDKLIVRDIINSKEVEFVEVSKEVCYDDLFFNKLCKQIKSGDMFEEIINEVSVNSYVAYKVDEKRVSIGEIIEGTEYKSYPILLFKDENLLDSIKYKNYLELEENNLKSVAISSEIYKSLYGEVEVVGPKVIEINNQEFNIDLVYNSFKSEQGHAYDGIFISEEDYLSSFNQQPFVPNFFSSRIENQYSNFLLVDSIDQINLELIYGDAPTNDYEILISFETLRTEFGDIDQMYIDNEILGKEYIIVDNRDEKYNGYYTDFIDYTDIINKKIKIVGVFDVSEGYNGSEIPDILVEQNVYNKIKDRYTNKYESILIIMNNNVDEFSEIYTKYNLLGDDSELKSLYIFEESIESIRSVISYSTYFLIIFTLLIIGFNSFVSVNNRKFDIAVMESLGIDFKDINLIYLFESLVFGILSTIISIVGYILALNYMNNGFTRNILKDRVLFYPSINTFILILFFSIFYSIVMSGLSLYKLYKTNTINNLNE